MVSPTMNGDIYTAILTETDNDRLKMWNRLIISRMRDLSAMSVQNFRYGNRVSFTGKFGQKLTGTVIRTNRKTVQVKVDNGVTWRVPGSLLTPIA